MSKYYNPLYHNVSKDIINESIRFKGDTISRGRIGANWLACLIIFVVALGGMLLYDYAKWALPYFLLGCIILGIVEIGIYIKKRNRYSISTEP